MLSKRTSTIVAAGLAVSLLLGGVVSYFASGSPDRLNKVAAEKGFDGTEKEHGLDDSPLAGYEAAGVDQGWLAGGLAGVAGVGLTFLVAAGLTAVVRRRRSDGATTDATPTDAGPAEGRRQRARDPGP